MLARLPADRDRDRQAPDVDAEDQALTAQPAATPNAPVRKRPVEQIACVKTRAGRLREVRAAVVVIALPACAERPGVEQRQVERGAREVLA